MNGSRSIGRRGMLVACLLFLLSGVCAFGIVVLHLVGSPSWRTFLKDLDFLFLGILSLSIALMFKVILRQETDGVPSGGDSTRTEREKTARPDKDVRSISLADGLIYMLACFLGATVYLLFFMGKIESVGLFPLLLICFAFMAVGFGIKRIVVRSRGNRGVTHEK